MPVTTAGINFAMNMALNEALGSFGGTTPLSEVFTKIFQWTGTGSGAGQFNAGYSKDRTVTNGTPDVFHLTDGSLYQPDGVTAAKFNDVLAFGIYAGGTSGQDLTVGGGTNAFTGILGATGTQIIKAGMLAFLGGAVAAGYAITYTTTITGSPTGGTFTISVAAGGTTQTTSAIAYNATAATVQAALQALSNVGTGNATVSGSTGGPYAISFTPVVGAASLTSSGASLTGGTSPAATTVANDAIQVTVASGTAVPYAAFVIGH